MLQIADVAAWISESGFTKIDCASLLQVLKGTCVKSSRKKQQSFESFLNFLRKSDWQVIARFRDNPNYMFAAFIDLLIERFGCINPTEATKKFLAAVIVFLMHQSRVRVDPVTMLAGIRKQWDLRKRQFLKKNPDGIQVYIFDFPKDITSFARIHPSLFRQLTEDEPFIANPLPVRELAMIEASFSNRGFNKISFCGEEDYLSKYRATNKPSLITYMPPNRLQLGDAPPEHENNANCLDCFEEDLQPKYSAEHTRTTQIV